MAETTTSPVLPQRRPWRREEYERFGELGLFPPDERLELVDGEVIRKLTQTVAHARGVELAEEALRRVFAEKWIRTRLPLAIGPHDEPSRT
jgi:hypothetical protein